MDPGRIGLPSTGCKPVALPLSYGPTKIYRGSSILTKSGQTTATELRAQHIYSINKTVPMSIGTVLLSHAKDLLLARQNLEHLSVALFAGAGHRSPLSAALSLERNLMGIFHDSSRLVSASYAICFNLIHCFSLIINLSTV